VRLHYPGTKLIYAVPNGVNKSPAARAKFKREGLTPGMPDVNIDIPSAPWHGMRIEFKRPGEEKRTSAEQKEAHRQLTDAGYFVVVRSDAREAFNDTWRYLNMEP
jgi:hypothetical protein